MASSVTEKLYPPTIGSSIPAFYWESDGNNGTVMKITVPFSMNRAVDRNLVAGLALKIKTVQSNTYLETLYCDNISEALSTQVATFRWSVPNKSYDDLPIRFGQYLKVQLAYQSNNNDNLVTGYFSTVATVKYTAKPQVYIQNMLDDITAYRKSFIGVYQPSEYDVSERPYSYIFNLYDRRRALIESSEWQLHNSDNNVNTAEYSVLEEAIDKYTYASQLTPNTEYFIEYGVRTINNLTVFSKLYVCMQIEAQPPEIEATLHAVNNFEEGYIELTLQPDDNTDPYTTGTYAILRTDNKTNYEDWIQLRSVYFDLNYNFENWSFKDFTIEQGIKYIYCIQQYNDAGIFSDKLYANDDGESGPTEGKTIYGDFEDMFIYDGSKQLKIRYNPKVSSFKTTLMEAKIDTIGSKFPFIFKNGSVEYKEFPISGMISYMADNANLFMSYEQELNLLNPELRRNGTPAPQVNIEYNSPTVSSVGYNYQAERKFKLRVLDWLNNGSIKLFRSPSEGNYLVRLMNVVLTPEDRVNRLIHSFSANAYEMAEFTYDNLVKHKIIKINVPIEELIGYDSVRIQPIVEEMFASGISTKRVNRFSIYEWAEVYAEEGTKIHIGEPNGNSEVQINANNYLQLQNDNVYLQDIWLKLSDFVVNGQLDSSRLEGTIVYQYCENNYIPAEFTDLANVKIKNEVATIRGRITTMPSILQTSTTVVNGKTKVRKEVLQYLVLHFSERSIVNVTATTTDNSAQLYYNGVQLPRLDPLVIYHDTVSDRYFQSRTTTNVTNVTSIAASSFNKNIELQYKDDNNITQTYSYTLGPPNETMIDVPLYKYTKISFGYGVVLNCAFQSRENIYKNT